MSTRARRPVLAALLALSSLGVLSADASARRMTDYGCPTPTGMRMCGQAESRAARNGAPAATKQGPLTLTAPATCRMNNVLVVARNAKAARTQAITVRLDGAVIGTTTKGRRHFVGVGVDCAELALGEHTLSATLVRRNGSTVTATRTLTRLDGADADDDVF